LLSDKKVLGKVAAELNVKPCKLQLLAADDNGNPGTDPFTWKSTKEKMRPRDLFYESISAEDDYSVFEPRDSLELYDRHRARDNINPLYLQVPRFSRPD
jgi:hypothetical protein